MYLSITLAREFVMDHTHFLFHSFFKIMQRYWVLTKIFPESFVIIIWFLPLRLLIWWITFIDSHMLNHPCNSDTKPTWSWWMIIYMLSWIQFVNILSRIFAYLFIKEIVLQVSFFCMPLFSFGGKAIVVS